MTLDYRILLRNDDRHATDFRFLTIFPPQKLLINLKTSFKTSEPVLMPSWKEESTSIKSYDVNAWQVGAFTEGKMFG